MPHLSSSLPDSSRVKKTSELARIQVALFQRFYNNTAWERDSRLEEIQKFSGSAMTVVGNSSSGPDRQALLIWSFFDGLLSVLQPAQKTMKDCCEPFYTTPAIVPPLQDMAFQTPWMNASVCSQSDPLRLVIGFPSEGWMTKFLLRIVTTQYSGSENYRNFSFFQVIYVS
eukprot:GFKZ01012548.1.p1 GENE.GFKZ01012548.1~~GFKZ01012548.1.p1  ORF type:complete len:170 (+),score=2.37 GFKZ01012548.1:3-512(+)